MIHKHLLITAIIENPPHTEEQGNQWLQELVQILNMNTFLQPISKYDNTIDNKGLTGIVGLTTSHCSFHCWEVSDSIPEAFINVDVYSCKDFDPNVVIAHLEMFRIKSIVWDMVDRNPFTMMGSFGSILH